MAACPEGGLVDPPLECGANLAEIHATGDSNRDYSGADSGENRLETQGDLLFRFFINLRIMAAGHGKLITSMANGRSGVGSSPPADP
jgi:hypothetical protein